jgi:Uma2 family endonuclease
MKGYAHKFMEVLMSSIAVRTYLTPEEYLTFERKAITKHEYFSGEIVAMSGASNAHNLITGDVFAELHGQLKGGKCLVYTSDMRVKTSPTTSYFYPDITVVCDKPRFEDHTFDTLLNPTVVIEVRNLHVISRLHLRKNTSLFPKIRFGPNTIYAGKLSGCRPNFGNLMM